MHFKDFEVLYWRRDRETDISWAFNGIYSLSETIQVGLGLREDDFNDFGERVNSKLKKPEMRYHFWLFSTKN